MHRTVNGLAFRIVSPSVWQFVDYPAQLVYNGAMWVLSMNGQYREFARRDDALNLIQQSMINCG